MQQGTDPLGGARRIVVYGVTGSGKTVAAERIGRRTGIPWVPVDDLMWEPGWVQVPAEEQRRRMERVCAGERWILDTAYGAWVDVPLGTADLIVALDYPRWLSLGRLLRRTAHRIVDRRPICNGNTETVRQTLSSESIIAWHFRSFTSKRTRIDTWERADGAPRVQRFRRPRDLDRWIASVQPVAADR